MVLLGEIGVGDFGNHDRGARCSDQFGDLVFVIPLATERLETRALLVLVLISRWVTSNAAGRPVELFADSLVALFPKAWHRGMNRDMHVEVEHVLRYRQTPQILYQTLDFRFAIGLGKVTEQVGHRRARFRDVRIL